MEDRHGYIGRQHEYKCEAIHQQYIGVLTLFEGITGILPHPTLVEIFGHLVRGLHWQITLQMTGIEMGGYTSA